jgi:hypothetical protein
MSFSDKKLIREVCAGCVFLLIIISGCEKKCLIDDVDFDTSLLTPIQVDKNSTNDCQISVLVEFPEKEAISGFLGFEDDKFFIDLVTKERAYVFDLTSKIDEFYFVNFGEIGSNVEVKIDDIFRWKNEDVYKFRIKKIATFFDNKNYRFDFVFFVSRKKFILGSYISTFDHNIEIVISPQGEILREVIDYSKMEFRELL